MHMFGNTCLAYSTIVWIHWRIYNQTFAKFNMNLTELLVLCYLAPPWHTKQTTPSARLLGAIPKTGKSRLFASFT